ncbi:flagellar filament capping protein FliD [Shewanella sp. A25]|nr:flagellar filament capping protein FliD [Shewanella shenzhenensis]
MSLSALSIDPANLASQYTAIDRATKDALLSSQLSTANAKLKAFTSLKTAMSSFATKLTDALKDNSLLASSAKVSDDSIMSVTANGTAASGSYDIFVKQVAQAHQLSASFATDAIMPNSGELGISVGGDEFVVDLSQLSAGASLSDVAKLINNSSDNTGVTASVMRSGDTNYLVFTSDETGAESEITLSYTGSDTTFGNAMSNVTEMRKAQDAIVSLGSSSSIEITSSSNKLTKVIDGVTIDLTKAQASDDDPITVTIAEDSDASATNIKTLVTEYNSLMKTLTGDDIGNDSTARSIKNVMRTSFQGMFEGSTLYSIGLEFDRSGTLSLDTTKLKSALEDNSAQVEAMLTGDNGVLTKLKDSLEPYTERYGLLKNKVDNLQTTVTNVTKKQTAFDAKMDTVYARYLKQFTQMQVTIAQMESSMSQFA